MLNDHYWTSKQYITMELIKNYRVLYVEANYSFGKILNGLMGKKWPVTPFGKLYINNDKRSEIKLEINNIFGSKIVEVKSYTKY